MLVIGRPFAASTRVLTLDATRNARLVCGRLEVVVHRRKLSEGSLQLFKTFFILEDLPDEC